MYSSRLDYGNFFSKLIPRFLLEWLILGIVFLVQIAGELISLLHTLRIWAGKKFSHKKVKTF